VPIVEVLDRCYEHHRTEPTLGELVLFAKANRIPFPRKERGRPYSSLSKNGRAAASAGDSTFRVDRRRSARGRTIRATPERRYQGRGGRRVRGPTASKWWRG
jgi:hypothetical protein